MRHKILINFFDMTNKNLRKHHDIKNVLSHIEIKILSAAPEKICDAPLWAFKCVGSERGVEEEKKICRSWFARRVIISIEQPTFLLAPPSLCIGRALSKSSLTFVNLYLWPTKSSGQQSRVCFEYQSYEDEIGSYLQQQSTLLTTHAHRRRLAIVFLPLRHPLSKLLKYLCKFFGNQI